MRYDSLTEAVRLLGSFSGTIDIPASQEPYTSDPESDVHVAFSELFAHSKEEKYVNCMTAVDSLRLDT